MAQSSLAVGSHHDTGSLEAGVLKSLPFVTHNIISINDAYTKTPGGNTGSVQQVNTLTKMNSKNFSGTLNIQI